MDKEHHLEADEQHVPATPSPGQVLREAREQQELTQQAIADKLYLKVGIIDDIEQNRIDEQTSITFIKGYVRLYAKTLGLNQQEMITVFEQYHTTPKPPAKLQSFSRRVAKQAHDDRWMMVTYGIALIIIAGIVIWWYQQSANDTEEATTTTGLTSQQTPAAMTPTESDDSLTVEAAPQRPRDELADNQPQESINAANTLPQSLDDSVNAVPAQLATEQAESVADTGADTQIPPVTTASESPAVSEAEPVESDNYTATAGQSDTSSLQSADLPSEAVVDLIFTFNGECWVNLTDATGEAIAYGIKASGYVMRVSGIPPFEVTLGAPSVVEIEYDGDVVDMSGFDPTRTAKFLLPRQEQ
ncbi:RodZ domain-containing protein [Alteromonas gilva]|uniref:DUF4115 domain-containing protein n=1 Tax=Alteromonas gilva TaxID=2987522 RepID=A0ABT5L6L6_9ALTE|nr:RodZ domain-containing protein [Alteromonas gilva]MDC8832699.1 DUF4115 domain-containing protein [Alteromonas gilva]